MNIREIVYNYPTKHKEGFIQSEIDALLKEFPNIDMERFKSALFCITCMGKGNEVIIYRHDIEKALVCGIEKRNLHQSERD